MTSPEIAETLLISAVVGFALFIAAWYTGLLTGVSASQRASCTGAALQIRDVYIISSRGVGIVQNIGSVDLALTGGLLANGTITTDFPLGLSPGSIAELDLRNTSCAGFELSVWSNCSNAAASWTGLPKGC